jgi:tRNA(Ile)-lysidine synthase
VAFSGGADSLALLLLLWAHWPERREKLVALHFNHRLRGRASEADERFCRRVCAALGVKCAVGRWNLGPKGGPRKFSEAAAREARMGFFQREQKRRRAPTLWLGHQQDDIAESMLMRLARGSGTAGLAAPRPVQPWPGRQFHVRPLLSLKKREIAAALRAAGATWREDGSNACGEHFRNRIRRSVLPAWRRAAEGRDALAGAALARSLLEEDDTALAAWADRLAGSRPGARLELAPLAAAPRAILRRVLHRWLLAQPDAGDLSRAGFERLLALVQLGRPTRFSLGSQGFAVIRAGALRFERHPRAVKAQRSRQKFARAKPIT